MGCGLLRSRDEGYICTSRCQSSGTWKMGLAKVSEALPHKMFYAHSASLHYSQCSQTQICNNMTKNEEIWRFIKNLQTQAHSNCLGTSRHRCSFPGRRIKKNQFHWFLWLLSSTSLWLSDSLTQISMLSVDALRSNCFWGLACQMKKKGPLICSTFGHLFLSMCLSLCSIGTGT